MTKREILSSLRIIESHAGAINIKATLGAVRAMIDDIEEDLRDEEAVRNLMHAPGRVMIQPIECDYTPLPPPAYYGLWNGRGSWSNDPVGVIQAYLSPAPLFAWDWTGRMIDAHDYRVAVIPPDGGEPTQFIEKPVRA